jgi:YfiH family protein
VIARGDGTLAFESLAARGGIRHAVTTRALGDLKSEAARGRLARALGVPEGALVRGRQVHGSAVALVAEGGAACVGDEAAGADALATRDRGRVLLTLCADCAPVALVDPDAGALAVAHAGWRGAVAGIAGKAARLLVERLGARPERIVAAIGPCIGACCYEVGDEVAVAARNRPGGEIAVRAPAGGEAKPRLDLAALIRADLVAAGVADASIEAAGLCPRCRQDLFYSHRATGTAERFGLAVGLA